MKKLSTVLKDSLIVRIIIAIGLIVISLLPLFSDFLKVLMLIFSVLISGFDLIIIAYYAIKQRNYLNQNLIIIVCLIILFIIGYSSEAAIICSIYQLGLLLISKTTDFIRTKSFNSIDKRNADIITLMYDVFDGENADVLLMENQMSASVSLTFIILIIFAVIYAVLMPIIKNLSYIASIHRAVAMILVATPWSMISSYPAIGSVALCNAAQNGIIFTKAYYLEAIADSRKVILDDDLFNSKISSKLLYSHSSSMNNDTFLNFVYHVVYYSDQDFSNAIKNAVNIPYQEGLVLGAIDIPGYGIKASINGMNIIFGNYELCSKFGIDLEDEFDPEIRGNFYFLCISNRCVGSVVLSEETIIDSEDIIESFKDNGATCTFSMDENAKKSSKRAIISIFLPKNKEKYNSDINIVISDDPFEADGCIIPDYIDNISLIPYMSRRLSELASHNSFFAFGFKIIIVIASILGFCVPWISVSIEIVVSIICILNALRFSKASIITKFKK